MSSNWDKGSPAGSTGGGEKDKQKRKIRFMPLPKTPKVELSLKQNNVWSPVQGLRVRTSIWLWIAILLLFISNVLYAVAFLTNGWGLLYVEAGVAPPQEPGSTTPFVPLEGIIAPPREGGSDLETSGEDSHNLFAHGEKFWAFGLWECCRNDGFCLGARWPAFYSATRAFAVLALFGHVLTLTWLIGHALENLLEYDPCTVVALITLNVATCVFLLLAVVCFGTRWPVEFSQDFNGHSTSLAYSFWLAVTCVLLTAASSVFSVVDFMVTLRALSSLSRDSWVTAEQILGHDEEGEEGRGIEDRSFTRLTSQEASV